jgi:phytoene dehydrogenase-like protein
MIAPPQPRTETAGAEAVRGKVVIIGAGVAGLACGGYLQMNGIPTVILEAGGQAGGLCTAWHRGPYIFDGCLRWLMGAQPPSSFHQIWTELGALADREIFIHKDMGRMEWADGTHFCIPANLDRLANELKQLAPEDTVLIDRLIRDARCCSPLEPPLENPVELMSLWAKIKLGLRYWPMAPVVMRYKNQPITQYIAQYKNKRLREILDLIVGNRDMSALVLVMLLAFRTRNNTGFVAGGSEEFALAITERYRKLGGDLRLNTCATSVKVENRHAVGVQCANGTWVPAIKVVSCADGHTTIFKMLEGKYVNRGIRFLYDNCQPFPPLLQISLGIRKVFPHAPHTLNLPTAQPLAVDDQTRHERLEVETFSSASRLCPEGTTLMTVRLPTRYEYWRNLKTSDVVRYRSEKRRIVNAVIATLEPRFAGLTQHLERSDIATPPTFTRYTGNWQGSYEGWLPTPRILGHRIPFTLPRLKDFFMAGHWVVAGGGLPSAALAGRYVAQIICAQLGKKFVPTVP